MAGDKSDTRKARLAAALKENLKRRKAQKHAKAGTMGSAPARAPQKPGSGLKSAPKGD
jgi:hypothetical protein